MKITIDRKRCMGAAVCTDVCENVFTLDSEGTSQLRETYQGETPYEGTVPNDLPCVKEAANYCPANAISIEPSADPRDGKKGRPRWWRRFWVQAAIFAVLFAVGDYIAYHFHLIDLHQLLRTPFYLLGALGLWYLVRYIHTKVLAEQTLRTSRRIACVLMGTFFLGFLLWMPVSVTLGFFGEYVIPGSSSWWIGGSGFLVTIGVSYVLGTGLGYGLSTWFHVNRAMYILAGMFFAYLAVFYPITYLFSHTSELRPAWGDQRVILLFLGVSILGGFLGDWIGKWRGYRLPGSLEWEPRTEAPKNKERRNAQGNQVAGER